MFRNIGRACLLASSLLAATKAAPGENWPQWRGPSSNGVSAEKGLPTTWSADKGIAWKAPLRGLGTSTPIVWDDLVFVTSQLGMGRIDRRGAEFDEAVEARDYADRGVSFVVAAFSRTDGSLVWEDRTTLERPAETLPAVHPKHNLASPSVVTDGERVYAWMGNGLVIALSLDGKRSWSRDIGDDYARFDVLWGHGSSPTLYDDSLILLCDHPDEAYLIALEASTGKQQWKIERGTGIRSYSTPYVVRDPGGDELIVNGSHRVESFDPKTGRLRWFAGEEVTLAIGMPVRSGRTLYASRGYSSGPYFALELGGTGDVNETHMKWRVPTRAPYISSLLYYEGLLFMATERGIVSVVDPNSGDTLWRQRLGGAFTASPVAGDGKVYFTNEAGETFVIAPTASPEVLATNSIDERTLASPAISGGTLFLRSDAHLFAIREDVTRP